MPGGKPLDRAHFNLPVAFRMYIFTAAAALSSSMIRFLPNKRMNERFAFAAPSQLHCAAPAFHSVFAPPVHHLHFSVLE